jgi:2-polyprenyl-3-methyl-5-hydroxy-6-metoxy-1,4-benzoquinol methylase
MSKPATPSASTGSVADVLDRYSRESLGTRFYLAVRRVLLSLPAVEQCLPTHGRILDAGCGYGLVSIYAAIRGPGRQVRGIDIDASRIEVARRVSAGVPNLSFDVVDLVALKAASVDAVILIDTLHYFDRRTQIELLRACRRALVPGGVLVCRDVIRSNTPRFWWNWFHERVMTGLSITATRDRTLCFLRMAEMRGQFASAGYTIERVQGPRYWLPYADHIFVARAT